MESATEKVKVLCIDGEEKEVLIYKYLSFRKKQQIINKLTEGLKINSNQKEDIEIDAAKGMHVFGDLAEAIWADKNVKLDDVEGESLYKLLTERFDTFLGGIGFTAKATDNQSS